MGPICPGKGEGEKRWRFLIRNLCRPPPPPTRFSLSECPSATHPLQLTGLILIKNKAREEALAKKLHSVRFLAPFLNSYLGSHSHPLLPQTPPSLYPLICFSHSLPPFSYPSPHPHQHTSPNARVTRTTLRQLDAFWYYIYRLLYFCRRCFHSRRWRRDR